MSPETAVGFVASVAMKKGHKPLYTIGFGYRPFTLIMKLFPAGLTNHLVGGLYAK